MISSTPTRQASASAGFADIDAAADPDFFLRYLLEASADPEVQAMKEESFSLLDLRPGLDVLEIGSGLGDDLARMWSLARPGRAVGVDGSQYLVARARERHSELPLELVHGDAQALAFADGEFDRYRAERVFQHLPEPERALDEALRVLRPGGRLVVGDPDWRSLRLGSDDQEIDELLCERVCQAVAHPQVPYSLAAWLLARGQILGQPHATRLPYRQAKAFVRVVDSAADSFSPEERQLVLDEAHRLEAEGRLYGSLTVHWVSALKR